MSIPMRRTLFRRLPAPHTNLLSSQSVTSSGSMWTSLAARGECDHRSRSTGSWRTCNSLQMGSTLSRRSSTAAQVFQRPSIFIAAAVMAACGVALIATLAVVVTVMGFTRYLKINAARRSDDCCRHHVEQREPHNHTVNTTCRPSEAAAVKNPRSS